MGALLITFVTVLITETGGRLSYLRSARQTRLAAFIAGILVGGAATGSLFVASQLTPEARLLLIAIALIFAGIAKCTRTKTKSAPLSALATTGIIWGSTAPFTAFAMSVWLNDPIGAAIGALAGLGSAAIIPPVIPRGAMIAMGVMLITLGILAGLNGLRLI